MGSHSVLELSVNPEKEFPDDFGNTFAYPSHPLQEVSEPAQHNIHRSAVIFIHDEGGSVYHECNGEYECKQQTQSIHLAFS
jgi:hypothetical protein